MVAVYQLLTDSANKNLIWNTPEHNRRMIIILNNQFSQFTATMLMCIFSRFEHTDKRNLSPDCKSQSVTSIIKILTMLIMCQTNRVSPQFLNNLSILNMLLCSQRISFIKPVLMARYTTKWNSLVVNKKSTIRCNRITAYTSIYMNFIICLVVFLQTGNYCIQIWLVHTPQLRIWNIDCHCSIICRTNSSSDLTSTCILNAVHNSKTVLLVSNKTFNFKSCTAVFCWLWCHFDARTSVVIQIKMSMRNTD